MKNCRLRMVPAGSWRVMRTSYLFLVSKFLKSKRGLKEVFNIPYFARSIGGWHSCERQTMSSIAMSSNSWKCFGCKKWK